MENLFKGNSIGDYLRETSLLIVIEVLRMNRDGIHQEDVTNSSPLPEQKAELKYLLLVVLVF